MDLAELRQRHPEHWRLATALRVLAMDAVQAAKSGHPGMPMGMADAATVLFAKHLKFDPSDPGWPDRDRFVLSAGHGSMLLYGLLHLTGYADMTLDELRAFRQLGSKTAGHPEHGHAAGIETTTGPLGQGLANAVGMAMAERSMAARFAKVVDHATWTIVGDGCLMEGISHEAIALAGRQRLEKLTVIWDDNGISIDGAVSLADVTDQPARFAACGWEVIECDGHDPEALDEAMKAATLSLRPTLIAAKTRIGYGAPKKEGTAGAHGAPLGPDEIAATRAAYGWEHGPFEIPGDVREGWARIGRRGAAARADWLARLNGLSERKRAEFERVVAGDPPKRLASAIKRLKTELAEDGPSLATRKASEMALSAINPVTPETLGGSADLTGSNNTRTPELGVFDPDAPEGRYIHYGVREHAMAAAMNGMALHGGAIPYGGTFLVFADYSRPAIRLAALMGIRVIHVMTHDSIGLGEDGPTHQPVEQLAALRAIPNLRVLRPADAIETAEAWEIALATPDGPSVIALTRQNLPTFRAARPARNQVAFGAYVAAEAEARRRAILIATGSEVAIAMAARTILEGKGIGTRVVSAPCWELFAAQDEAYRKRVLPRGPVRVGVEAAVRGDWDRWLCAERGDVRKADFVGMEGFGASGPYEALYARFGITPEAVAARAEALL